MKHFSWILSLVLLCALALSATILACGSEEATERQRCHRHRTRHAVRYPLAGRTLHAVCHEHA